MKNSLTRKITGIRLDNIAVSIIDSDDDDDFDFTSGNIPRFKDFLLVS